jgi:CRP-like cAMP-binding protein
VQVGRCKKNGEAPLAGGRAGVAPRRGGRGAGRTGTYFSVQGEEEFYSPEKHDSGLFLILEGRVRVYLTTPAGKEATLTLLDDGTVV